MNSIDGDNLTKTARVSKMSTTEQLLRIPLGEYTSCVRYDDSNCHILCITDTLHDDYLIAAPIIKCIGCLVSTRPSVMVHCSNCMHIPENDACLFARNTFGYSPLYEKLDP